MNEKYLWIIGGGLLQVPLIKEANKLGLKTIISDLNENCIAKYFCDIFVHIDIFNIDEHINYLKTVTVNIVGVLAAGIDAPETMAAMNEFLGLRGVSLKTALLVKNKDQFRVKLKELDYDMPKFEIITKNSISKLEEILLNIPYPLIVKPTNNSASRDMKIFYENSKELILFIKSKIKKYEILLIEELWIGEEQTVECLIDNKGVFHKGFITDRKFTFENGFPVEIGLVHPSELSVEKQEALYTLAKRVSKDLEIDIGAVKLDTIYTKDGPRIIELTVRHSGGFDCQFLVPLSTGKNILKAAILSAIDETFDINLLENKFERYGTTGSLWPTPGVIKSIKGIKEAKVLSGVEEIFLRYEVGDEIKPYIDCASRVIFIICTGISREAAFETLEKAKTLIKIETEL
jgi:biotin carboxylase